MTTKNDLFCMYVNDFCGGSRSVAAERLNRSVQLVGHLMNGIRQVSPATAIAIHDDTGGKISKAAFRPDFWKEHEAA